MSDQDRLLERLLRIERAARDVDNLAPAHPAMGGDWSDDAIAALIYLRAELANPSLAAALHGSAEPPTARPATRLPGRGLLDGSADSRIAGQGQPPSLPG